MEVILIRRSNEKKRSVDRGNLLEEERVEKKGEGTERTVNEGEKEGRGKGADEQIGRGSAPTLKR